MPWVIRAFTSRDPNFSDYLAEEIFCFTVQFLYQAAESKCFLFHSPIVRLSVKL